MQITESLLKEMIDFFGADNIPNPDHSPRQFSFLVMSFKYYLQRNPKKTLELGTEEAK